MKVVNVNLSKKEKLFIYFFIYLVVSWPTLGHYLGGSLTPPLLISAFHLISTQGHQEPQSEVRNLSLAECIVGTEPSIERSDVVFSDIWVPT